MFSLNLLWHSFMLFLCALSLGTREKGLASPSPLRLHCELQRALRLPPFLQTRQPKCSQPLLIGHALQAFYHLCCSPLYGAGFVSLKAVSAQTVELIKKLIKSRVEECTPLSPQDKSPHPLSFLKDKQMSVMFDTVSSKQRRQKLSCREVDAFCTKVFCFGFGFPLSLLFPYWNTATSLQMLSRSQTRQILQFKPEKEYFGGTGRVLNNAGREIAVDSKSKCHYVQFLHCVCTHMHVSVSVFRGCELLWQLCVQV